ncbi:MAG: hypothetical protein SVV80_04675 [Planctomycetota bacterium]|nr:hypothetical protein [Planctomycetota bacterium]
MDIGKASSSSTLLILSAVIMATSTAIPVSATEVLIEGFEKPEALKTWGKFVPVKAADAVTEGKIALQLLPDAKVTIFIPANAVSRVGWLKIDTFEVHPVMASLLVSFKGVVTRRGYVSPGRDTLTVPLGLACRTHRLSWPTKAVTLELQNAGSYPVVVDNVRLVAPADPPDEAILLDFGPPDQVLWPGFEPAGAEGSSVAWSGNHEIASYAINYPDPLLGDFSGRRLEDKQLETIIINSKERGSAWVWLTHYNYYYSSPVEYAAKINRKSILRRRFSPSQMLSIEGLLRGKNEPWTTQWFQNSFTPATVSAVEFPLKAEKNRLEITNCQLAAVIIAPQKSQDATRAYVRQLEQDLRRYRRQFVLAAQHRLRCDVAPTEDETKAGSVVFSPPRDEWFTRTHIPKAEHRAGIIKLTVAAGSAATTALAVAPCRDGKVLRARIDELRDVGKSPISKTGLELYALDKMPVVEDACVRYQPFLVAQNFRNVRAGGVYWFVLRVKVPQRTRNGNYRGTVHVSLDWSDRQIPVELEVVNIGLDRSNRKQTFAVMSTGDCFDAYRSLKFILPTKHQNKVARDILNRLYDAGFNSVMIRGPSMSPDMKLLPEPTANNLQNYPRPDRPGKMLVSLEYVYRMLNVQKVQTGTARYFTKTNDAVRLCNDLAGKNKLSNYALYCGYGQDEKGLSEITSRVLAVRRVRGGKPAVGILSSSLSKMDSGSRATLLAALDTLVCRPNHKDIGGIGEEFKNTGQGKTFALMLIYPDVYTGGFYCWGVGADGAYLSQIFHYRPLFNAFSFSPQSLLLPTTKGGEFEPTLGLLKFQQGLSDYDLARRCEMLVMTAKQKSKDTSPLEKILTEIRITADAKPPAYNIRLMRATAVSPEQLEKWRAALIREAGKVYEQINR